MVERTSTSLQRNDNLAGIIDLIILDAKILQALVFDNAQFMRAGNKAHTAILFGRIVERHPTNHQIRWIDLGPIGRILMRRFGRSHPRWFTEGLIDIDLDVWADETLHHIQNFWMAGVFVEQFVITSQIPDFSHIVETHQRSIQFAAFYHRLNLHILGGKRHDLVADVFQTLVQCFDFQRREQFGIGQESHFVKLFDLFLVQRHDILLSRIANHRKKL